MLNEIRLMVGSMCHRFGQLLLGLVLLAAGAMLSAPVNAAAVHGSVDAIVAELAQDHGHAHYRDGSEEHDAKDHVHDVPHPTMSIVVAPMRWASSWSSLSLPTPPPGHPLRPERPPRTSL